jgi:hypothetical protein
MSTYLLLVAMSPFLHVEGSRTRLGAVVVGRCCSGWCILVSTVAFHLKVGTCPFFKAFLLLLLSHHLHIFCYTVTLHLVGGLLLPEHSLECILACCRLYMEYSPCTQLKETLGVFS